jgi:aryl-alcohol dehydrogenase-like predicted oxidoreductase
MTWRKTTGGVSRRASRRELREEPRPRQKVEDLAKARGATPAQLALAWVLAQGEDILPIPGTKRRDRLEENLKAFDLDLRAGRLSPSSKRWLPAAPWPDSAIRSPRCPW